MKEELKTFKVTLSTCSESAGPLTARLKKFYRRRAESVTEQEPDRLKISMRNGTQIYCKLNDHSKWSRFSSEPIAEILITTTSSYLDYTIKAAKTNAERSNLSLRIETEEQKPRT